MSNFITIDGPDGLGKTTALERIIQYSNENGIDSVKVKEPGTTDFGKMISKHIMCSPELKTEDKIALFSSSRMQLINEVIQPYLLKGFNVYSDRFWYSTLVYQGLLESPEHLNTALDFIKIANENLKFSKVGNFFGLATQSEFNLDVAILLLPKKQCIEGFYKRLLNSDRELNYMDKMSYADYEKLCSAYYALFNFDDFKNFVLNNEYGKNKYIVNKQIISDEYLKEMFFEIQKLAKLSIVFISDKDDENAVFEKVKNILLQNNIF